ncbi:G1/S-specific cyclin-E-like [Ornithodoros turicata]|uniref:G1/S-specific cyclin-E-like n=1 Tax=Ornithodoros turicata TaxID=34597 RepID=UPI003139CB77
MSKKNLKSSRPKRSRSIIEPNILRRKRRTGPTIEEYLVPLDESTDGGRSLLDDSFESEAGSVETQTPKNYSHFRGIHCLPTPESSSTRASPLPQIPWADPENVWGLMVRKDVIYEHSAAVLNQHPALQPRMRTILLDWLIEVCEVYRLHRDTYYLAQDFVDRYLTKSSDLPKSQLQLLGITALFLAAKMEEIYPPKLTEFAYVTDGACQESEILDKELSILTALNWDLTPVTVNGWLNVYLQVAADIERRESGNEEENFLHPRFSTCAFARVAQLVDLCMLDIECLQFPYSIVAATALHHMMTPAIASAVSGYKTVHLLECIEWMAPFAAVAHEELKHGTRPQTRDSHEIQVHHVNIQLLDKALCLKKEYGRNSTPPKRDKTISSGLGLLTPPPPE